MSEEDWRRSSWKYNSDDENPFTLIKVSLSLSCLHTFSLSFSLPLSLIHAYSLSLSHTHTHILSLFPSLFLSLSYTHAILSFTRCLSLLHVVLPCHLDYTHPRIQIFQIIYPCCTQTFWSYLFIIYFLGTSIHPRLKNVHCVQGDIERDLNKHRSDIAWKERYELQWDRETASPGGMWRGGENHNQREKKTKTNICTHFNNRKKIGWRDM